LSPFLFPRDEVDEGFGVVGLGVRRPLGRRGGGIHCGQAVGCPGVRIDLDRRGDGEDPHLGGIGLGVGGLLGHREDGLIPLRRGVVAGDLVVRVAASFSEIRGPRKAPSLGGEARLRDGGRETGGFRLDPWGGTH